MKAELSRYNTKKSHLCGVVSFKFVVRLVPVKYSDDDEVYRKNDYAD